MVRDPKRLLWTSALVAPWLAFSAATGETVDVVYSEQDNVSFVGASDSEIERLIHFFGVESPWTITATDEDPKAEPGDGVPLLLHQIADQITLLYREKRYAELFQLLKENPNVRTARPEVNQLEAWSYYHSNQAKTAMALFQSLYIKSPSAALAVGVIYSGMRSEYYTRTWEFARVQGGPLAKILKPGEKAPTGEPKDTIEKTQLDFLNGWVRAAIRYKKIETADKVARLLGFDSADEIRAETLIDLGWQAHKAKDFEKAGTSFSKVSTLKASAKQAIEAHYGHALSLRDTGDLEGSVKIIKLVTSPDKRLLSLLGEITLQQGHAAYDAESYTDSLGLALSIKSPENDPRAAWLLEGWSLLKLDRTEEAADVFVPAYRKLPDQESADGVTASLLALGRRDDIVSLSKEIEGPLKPPAAQTDGAGGTYVMSAEEQAFYRGDFAMATPFKPEVGETLAPWLGVTLNYKSRDGDKGLGKLNLTGSKASYDFLDKTLHIRAELEVMHVDAGSAPANPELSGFAALTTVRPYAATFDDTVFQPSLHFRNEGTWGTEVSVGTSPLEGEVEATITGHLNVIHSRDGGRYSAGIHRRTIYESLLSISGMKDTVTGTAWGGVIETGVHGDLYHPLGKDFAIVAEGRWGERTGRYVDTNKTSFFNLGAVYSFDAKGFSYLAVGPSFQHTSFEKNRSFFTFGHGGYYSPAQVHAVSLNLNFMTEEGRDWIVRGSASAGYEEAENDAAPYYPLYPFPGDPVYQASSSEGSSFALETVAARRINDFIVGEIGAYGIDTEGYSESGVFLKLRVSRGKRSKVWRTDLTEDLYRRYH